METWRDGINNKRKLGEAAKRAERVSMESVTFEFKSEKNWLRVWDALNDTMYMFSSYGYKAITVWGNGIEEVRRACKESRIAYKEI